MNLESKNIALGKSFHVSHFSWTPTSAALAFVCVLLLVGVRPAQAQAETVLYNFLGKPDGANPDSKGNLYGTTADGGSSNAGIVFKVSPSGTETVLYTFAGGPDGANPTVALVRDKAGNLFGTTYNGGNGNGSGDGTVFEISPSGTHTVLRTFTGGADGAVPDAGLILDKHGNLYGTTLGGGIGFGVVYELTP